MGSVQSTRGTRGTQSPAVLRLTVCLVLGLCAPAHAQPAARRATNIAAILAYPSFYHLRPILIVGTVAQRQNGEFHVSDMTGSLRVIPDGNAPDGLDEVRGQFWDPAMKPDDPRLAGFDLSACSIARRRVAASGDVTAIVASARPRSRPLRRPPLSSPRPDRPRRRFSVDVDPIDVLEPSRYRSAGTITGQFFGRNLAAISRTRRDKAATTSSCARRRDLGNEHAPEREGRRGSRLS